MKTGHGVRLIMLLLIMSLLSPAAVIAANETGDKSQNQDQKKAPFGVDVSLYFWGASLASSLETPYADVDVDYSLSDILKDIKMCATGNISVSYNDWYFLADIVYLNVKPDATDTVAVSSPPLPVPVDVTISGTADIKTSMDTFVIGKRFNENFPWAVFAGVRYFNTKLDMEADAQAINLPPPYNIPYHYSDTERDKWVLGTIGGEIKAPLTKSLELGITADIGFGDRDFDWEIVPLLYYKFNKMFSAAAGYRVVNVYHNRQDFKLNLVEQGPVVGVNFSF